jgi:hypothetical protein
MAPRAGIPSPGRFFFGLFWGAGRFFLITTCFSHIPLCDSEVDLIYTRFW